MKSFPACTLFLSSFIQNVCADRQTDGRTVDFYMLFLSLFSVVSLLANCPCTACSLTRLYIQLADQLQNFHLENHRLMGSTKNKWTVDHFI